MDIQILELIDGAKEAEGLTVIIDVFRAFSLECYLMNFGASAIYAVGSIAEAFSLKERIPDAVLIGERGGRKCEGFAFGNSPSQVDPKVIAGHPVIHTTSAGTQGVVHAEKASEIITGSLVNASAVADYIRSRQAGKVSLVAMGKGGIARAGEDILCAEYIRALVTGSPFPIERRIEELKGSAGSHFFNPETQEVFPQLDYWLCVQKNRFDFVLQMQKAQIGYLVRKIG